MALGQNLQGAPFLPSTLSVPSPSSRVPPRKGQRRYRGSPALGGGARPTWEVTPARPAMGGGPAMGWRPAMLGPDGAERTAAQRGGLFLVKKT
jgi:hypothetical protein